MIKNIYSTLRATALAIAVSFSVSSCLEKIPGDAIHENMAMKTFEDAEQTLTGIYAAFKSPALYCGYLTLAPDIQSDLVYAVEGNSNQYGNIWQWDILSTNSEIEAVYGNLYRIIGLCNFYLDRVDEVKKNLTDDEKITVLDYYTGEVHCARAMAYSELLKCFCEAYDKENAEKQLGVVLSSSYSNQGKAKRSNLKASYEFVLNDLEKAEELLDVKNDRPDNEYFTNAAAHAIHARTALFMEEWEEAVEEADKLIEHEDRVFALADVSRDPYAQMMMWHKDSSPEIIWKVGLTPTSYEAGLGQVFLNFNNDFTFYYPDYIPAQWVIRLFGQGDARVPAWFEEHKTGYPHGLQATLLMKYNGNIDFIKSMIYHVNMPKPLRLAEQYLIKAEALCELGRFGEAQETLGKMVQSRFTSNVKVNLSKDNWKDVISEERVKELYMEGFRLNDLKRWNKGFTRTFQAGCQKQGSSLKVNPGDPLFVWPIPKHEIEAPGGDGIEPNESNK